MPADVLGDASVGLDSLPYQVGRRCRARERPKGAGQEEDVELENDLNEQVSHNLRQSEIVDFIRVKYLMYS